MAVNGPKLKIKSPSGVTDHTSEYSGEQQGYAIPEVDDNTSIFNERQEYAITLGGTYTAAEAELDNFVIGMGEALLSHGHRKESFDVTKFSKDTYRGLAYSVIVVESRVGTDAGYTILVIAETGRHDESDKSMLERRERRAVNYSPERSINTVLIELITSTLSKRNPGLKYRPAGGRVVPPHTDLTSPKIIRELALYALGICGKTLKPGKDIIIARDLVDSKRYLKVDETYHSAPVTGPIFGNVTSEIMRLDLVSKSARESFEINANTPDFAVTSSGVRLSMLLYSAREDNVVRVKAAPQIIITNMSSALPSFRSVCLNVVTSLVAATEDKWVTALLHNIGDGTNPAVLNQLIRDPDLEEPLSLLDTNKLSREDKGVLIRSLITGDCLVGMDIEAFGVGTYGTALFSKLSMDIASGVVGVRTSKDVPGNQYLSDAHAEIVRELVTMCSYREGDHIVSSFPADFKDDIFASSSRVPSGTFDSRVGVKSLDDVNAMLILSANEKDGEFFARRAAAIEVSLMTDTYNESLELYNDMGLSNVIISGSKTVTMFTTEFLATLSKATAMAGLRPTIEPSAFGPSRSSDFSITNTLVENANLRGIRYGDTGHRDRGIERDTGYTYDGSYYR